MKPKALFRLSLIIFLVQSLLFAFVGYKHLSINTLITVAICWTGSTICFIGIAIKLKNLE